MDDKTLGYLLYVAIFVLLFGLGYWIITRMSKIEPKYKPEKISKISICMDSE